MKKSPLTSRLLRASLGISLVLSLSLIPLAPVYAQSGKKSDMELKNTVEIEVETKDAAGKVQRKRIPAVKALPGAEVIYTTTFKNIGSKPASRIVIDNPIPKHTTLVAGSAFGADTDISYSVDGKTFATPEKLKVKNKEGKEVAATAADYTHIRWAYRGDMAVGKTGEAGFRTIVK